jgi:hypothetical protein
VISWQPLLFISNKYRKVTQEQNKHRWTVTQLLQKFYRTKKRTSAELPFLIVLIKLRS